MHRFRHQTLRRRLFLSGIFIAAAAAAVAVAAHQPAPTPPAANSPTIQDPAELKAYTDAIKTSDPTARAEAFAAFIQDYPKTIVLTDALDQEMAAWQAAGDSSQVMKVAKRLVALDPGNIRALGIVVSLDRVSAEKGNLDALNEMCQDASGGMLEVPMWRQPANVDSASYVALSKLLNDIFTGAEGYCAVEQKNYSQAREWLGRALKLDPTNVQDNYQLGVADLESAPPDATGFWYCARAIDLAQSAAIPQDSASMVAYCKGKFAKYHGADDGWDDLVKSAATEEAPPADFAAGIKPAAAK